MAEPKFRTTIDVIDELRQSGVIKRLIRYLAAFRAVEGDLSIFDRLARAKDLEDFEKTIFEAIRVKDRVLRKIPQEYDRGRIEISLEKEEGKRMEDFQDIINLFDCSSKSLDKILEIISKARDSGLNTANVIRIVGLYLAIAALAYAGIRRRIIQKKEEKKEK